MILGMTWPTKILLFRRYAMGIEHAVGTAWYRFIIFDEKVKLSTSWSSKTRLVNQNRPKNYSAPLFNNTYASFSVSTTINTIPTQHQVTTTYTNPLYFQTDQNDPMDFSAANRGFKKPLTAEQRKHRVENNLCLYCGKSGHKIFDHKLIKFTQRINFVSEASTSTPLPPAQFAIENSPAPNQGKT